MTTWTNQSRNTTAFTNQSKDSVSFTNTQKSTVVATISAGTFIGLPFGLTYAVDTSYDTGATQSWTNQTKN